MILGKQLIESYEEDERLFSTGDEELDDILEEVYFSGLEDGYDYAQYEFAEVDTERTKRARVKAAKDVKMAELRNANASDRRSVGPNERTRSHELWNADYANARSARQKRIERRLDTVDKDNAGWYNWSKSNDAQRTARLAKRLDTRSKDLGRELDYRANEDALRYAYLEGKGKRTSDRYAKKLDYMRDEQSMRNEAEEGRGKRSIEKLGKKLSYEEGRGNRMTERQRDRLADKADRRRVAAEARQRAQENKLEKEKARYEYKARMKGR